MQQQPWMFGIGACVLIGVLIVFMINGCGKSGLGDLTDDTKVGAGKDDGTEKTADKDASIEDEDKVSPPVSLRNDEGIAVVDLNIVGRRLNELDKIDRAVSEKEKQFSLEFNALKAKLATEYRNMMNLAGDNPTVEQRQKLLDLQAAHTKQLNERWKALQNDLTDYHNSLKAGFRDLIRAFADRVATQKGKSIVLTANQAFSFNKTCDITNEVAERIEEARKLKKEKEARLNIQPNQGGGSMPVLQNR